MAMLDVLIKERNDALFSLDRKKIEAFCAAHGDTEKQELPDPIFWESVYKAICSMKNAPKDKVRVARAWLEAHHCSEASKQ